MAVQISGTFVHILANYLLVYYFDFGIMGTGFAGFFTSSYLLTLNYMLTKRVKGLEEAMEVRFRDPQILEQMGMYFKIGTPIVAVFFFDWMCFEMMTIMAGFLGVVEQATQVVLLNLLDQLFQISYGT
mmetsp:Transcript_2356/g.4036  ORF Transcript_2356/g.4036 Transcript_2356/m.4036 type:complete len:128 (+) Transcript_2356:399-782(+)